MTEIKLTKRYPNSRTEDITDAYMRGWNDALDAVQNGKFHIAEQTEPQTERIKTLDYCDICNHKGCDNCIANSLDDYCVPSGYEPTTQTETQNSNLTFEKDECAKEYEELGLKELKELIKADHKTENSSEKPNNCEELNAYRECIKSRSFWDSKHCDGCYFDERCPFDEPKDEPQTERNK